MPVTSINSGPPPKKTTPPPKKTTPVPTEINKIQKEREDGLNGIFQVVSAISIMMGQWADAGAYNIHGPNVSRETAALGARYEKVGSALDALSQVGPFTAILGAAMPLVLQLAANHNKLPAEKLASLGVVSPEVLESQMRMEALRQEMDMRAQMDEMKKMSEETQRIMNEDKVTA